MSFPSNLKMRRKAWGFSQSHLAYKVGVSAGQISHYETGKNRPHPKTAAKLCRVLKCTLYDLFKP